MFDWWQLLLILAGAVVGYLASWACRALSRRWRAWRAERVAKAAIRAARATGDAGRLMEAIHPNCRCTLSPILEAEADRIADPIRPHELGPLAKSARDWEPPKTKPNPYLEN